MGLSSLFHSSSLISGLGPLTPDGLCGAGVEAFPGAADGLAILRSIKAVGGTVQFIALDEPYYYGHFYDGTNACHWTAEKIAGEVGRFIRAAKEIFPEVIIGDTEPITSATGFSVYRDWLTTFARTNGYPLAFLHLDITWGTLRWPEEVRALVEHGRVVGVPTGIIYNGNSFDKTDEEYLSNAGERVKKLEIVNGVQPDQVVFESWHDKPDRVLPEADPYTFTGLISTYFRNKTALGWRREGKGANIAVGKTVRVSSDVGDAGGALAIDGDVETTWNSGRFPAQWIEIDLGGIYDISEIRLTVAQYPGGATVHRLLIKQIGSSYTLIHTFDGNTGDWQELVFSPTTAITKVTSLRVETVASPSWVAWREVVVIDAGTRSGSSRRHAVSH